MRATISQGAGRKKYASSLVQLDLGFAGHPVADWVVLLLLSLRSQGLRNG